MSHAPAAAASISRRVTRSLESVLSTLIAWAFGLTTAAVLFHVARALWSGEVNASSPLSLVPHAPAGARPFGLAYLGVRGAYCAGGQALAVLLALGMSMTISTGVRRLGLLALAAWSGLWAADAILLIAGSWHNSWWNTAPEILIGALALLVILAANMHRAKRLWRVGIKT